MTPGIDYALGAMICFGLADLLYKRAAGAGATAHQFLMVQSWFFLPAVFGYGLYTGGLALDRFAAWGLVAGLFAYAGFYNFARSLAGGAVSVNAPIFRLNFTITVALAVLILGEPLTARMLGGLALALAAVWLLLGARSIGTARESTAASLKHVLLATVALGITNFVYKLGLQGGATPLTMVAAQASAFMPLANAVAWTRDRGSCPPPSTWLLGAMSGVVSVVAFVLLLESLARGPASVMVPIAQMSFVVSAVLGSIFLEEPFTIRKGSGIAFALGALACLARG